jgi:hypothetical protein
MRKFIFLLLFLPFIINSQILSERDRATFKDKILADRFDNLLPSLMDRADIDMWLVISRV